MKITFLLVVLLMITGCACAQINEEVTPIDKDNIRVTTTYYTVVPKEHLLQQKKMLEGDIARAQEELAKINNLLSQYKDIDIR